MSRKKIVVKSGSKKVIRKAAEGGTMSYANPNYAPPPVTDERYDPASQRSLELIEGISEDMDNPLKNYLRQNTPDLPSASPAEKYHVMENPEIYLMGQILENPSWFDILVDGLNLESTIMRAVEPFVDGLHLDPEAIDWTWLVSEVLELVKSKSTGVTASLRRQAAFITAEYVVGRRLLGHRCTAKSPSDDIREWGDYLKVSAATFKPEALAFNFQLLKEATDALSSGSPRVAARLVAMVRKAFEAEAAGAGGWSDKLFQDEGLQTTGQDPYSAMSPMAPKTPRELGSGPAYEKTQYGTPAFTDEGLSGSDPNKVVMMNDGPESVELDPDWLDSSVTEGVDMASGTPEGIASDPQSEEYWAETMGLGKKQNHKDVRRATWTRVAGRIRVAMRRIAAGGPEELDPKTDPSEDGPYSDLHAEPSISDIMDFDNDPDLGGFGLPAPNMVNMVNSEDAPMQTEEDMMYSSNPESLEWAQGSGVAPSKVSPRLFARLLASFMRTAAKDEEVELQRFIPHGYDSVLGDMVSAEDKGFDTFPRTYAHVLKNYIMKRVNTASENSWLPHLINDGFVINRMDTNRGRGRKAE